jgi:hypothetical protein
MAALSNSSAATPGDALDFKCCTVRYSRDLDKGPRGSWLHESLGILRIRLGAQGDVGHENT